MPQARIVVLNAPRAIGAVLPAMTATAEANSAGVCRVTGAPGTMTVAAPRPPAVPRWGPQPLVQPSACAPTVIRPSLYVATPKCGAPTVYRGGTRISPVPALKPVLVVSPPRMQRPRRIGGRTVTRAGRALVRWPQYGGGYA